MTTNRRYQQARLTAERARQIFPDQYRASRTATHATATGAWPFSMVKRIDYDEPNQYGMDVDRAEDPYGRDVDVRESIRRYAE